MMFVLITIFSTDFSVGYAESLRHKNKLGSSSQQQIKAENKSSDIEQSEDDKALSDAEKKTEDSREMKETSEDEKINDSESNADKSETTTSTSLRSVEDSSDFLSPTSSIMSPPAVSTPTVFPETSTPLDFKVPPSLNRMLSSPDQLPSQEVDSDSFLSSGKNEMSTSHSCPGSPLISSIEHVDETSKEIIFRRF